MVIPMSETDHNEALREAGIQANSNLDDFQRLYIQQHWLPKELDWCRQILNRPVVIYFPTAKKLLLNLGAERRCIVGEKISDEGAHWVISPTKSESHSLMFKSLKDSNNLSIWCQDGPAQGLGWGTTTCDDATKAESFRIEKHPFQNRADSFLFQSELNGKYLQTNDHKPCCNNLNKLHWEEVVVIPLDKAKHHSELKHL